MKLIPYISLFLLFLSACNSETNRRTDFAVHGIDVSHHQSIIEWDSVGQQDIQFAFVKATEGKTMKDTNFCQNWSEMERVGLYRGAYHFFRPTISPLDQAFNYIDQVQISYGDFPPVLDVEVMDGVSKNVLITRVQTWLHIIEKEYRIRPIIYTNQKFYNTYLADSFKDYVLWIARYSQNQPEVNANEWIFWQYGNRGRMKGINGFVDFNVFHGDLEALKEHCLSPSPAFSTVY